MRTMLPFADRARAGRALGAALGTYRGREDVLVLGLPRGGIPVACEVADALEAPVDIMVVRKLGTPRHEELAMGAIASGGTRVLNPSVIGSLAITGEMIEAVVRREARELERREAAYRGTRERPGVEGQHVILVDDGIATGATMRAAIAALRSRRPAAVLVAVPVAPAETVAALRADADGVVCLLTPEPFSAVGEWYGEFPQLTDREVRALLARAWERFDARRRAAPAPQ